jgi:catechol 2,3-dioxygenase-like lactoylglutathione lyase family enzyme
MKTHPSIVAVSVATMPLLVASLAVTAAGIDARPNVAADWQQSNAARETSTGIPICGVAHVGIQVSDMEKSRNFYHTVLGFEEIFDRHVSGPQRQAIARLKINDQQFIDLFSGLRPEQPAPIRYVALYTDDIARLHKLLPTRGLVPGPISKTREGDLAFSIPNPPGLELTSLDFVQYLPESLRSTARGKGLSGRRLGTCINHVGLVASDLSLGRKFCLESLGFREANSKKRQDGSVYAIHLDLPGSSGEFFELSARPSQFDRHQGGIKTHLCLGAADPAAAYQQAVERGAKLEPVQNTRGKQEKFPYLLFDPDRSRIEFKLEPKATK